MVNYSFGAIANLTLNAVDSAIPSLAPLETIDSPIDPSSLPADIDQSSLPTIIPFSTTVATATPGDENLSLASIVGMEQHSNAASAVTSLPNQSLCALLSPISPNILLVAALPIGSTSSFDSMLINPSPAAPSPTITNFTTAAVPSPTTTDTTTAAVPSPTTTTPHSHAPSCHTPTNPYAPSHVNVHPPTTGDDLDIIIQDLKDTPVSAGAALAAKSTVCLKAYTAKKKKLVCEFLLAMQKKTPKYNTLLEHAKNKPSHFPPGPIVSAFVLLSRSEKKREKTHMLNSILIDWIAEKTNPRMKTKKGRSKFPTPATLNNTIRLFFAAPKERYRWEFTSKDFNFDGGYNAFFTQLVKMCQRDNVSTSINCCLSSLHHQYVFHSPFVPLTPHHPLATNFHWCSSHLMG